MPQAHAGPRTCRRDQYDSIQIAHLVVQGVPLQAVALKVLHAVLELPPCQGVGLDGLPVLKYLQCLHAHRLPNFLGLQAGVTFRQSLPACAWPFQDAHDKVDRHGMAPLCAGSLIMWTLHICCWSGHSRTSVSQQHASLSLSPRASCEDLARRVLECTSSWARSKPWSRRRPLIITSTFVSLRDLWKGSTCRPVYVHT